jgi:hypothetical protein
MERQDSAAQMIAELKEKANVELHEAFTADVFYLVAAAGCSKCCSSSAGGIGSGSNSTSSSSGSDK